MQKVITEDLSALGKILESLPDAWNADVGSSVGSSDDKYKNFKEKYRDDPVGFSRDCIMWKKDEKGLTDYQEDVMTKLVEHKRIAVRGPHGLGKTSVAAIIILWFILTRDGTDDWKIPTTASAWRQLTYYLWPEITRKWLNRVRWEVVGRDPLKKDKEVFTLNIRGDTGEAMAMAADDSDLIEGAHADEMLYVFDESKAIQDATWDSAEGAFSTGKCYWLAISTPGEPTGRFYDIHARKPGYDDWYARHVTLEEAIAAGRISRQWADQRLKQWGEKDERYKNRVLGEFANSQSDSIIQLSWVELANERWYSWKEYIEDGGYKEDVTHIGVDVARSGGDKTIFAIRRNYIIDNLLSFSKQDTMITAADLSKELIKNESAQANIEVVGVGAGVYDRSRELFKDRVIAFNPSKKTSALDRSEQWGFVDTRSAAWWHMRELLDPANGYEVALPPDENLTGDLIIPKWGLRGEKIKVQSKEEISKVPGRSGKSTDEGDAVVISFWEEEIIEEGMEYA
jgi:hypothetical protein